METPQVVQQSHSEIQGSKSYHWVGRNPFVSQESWGTQGVHLRQSRRDNFGVRPMGKFPLSRKQVSSPKEILIANLEKTGIWRWKWKMGWRNEEIRGEKLPFSFPAGFKIDNYGHSTWIGKSYLCFVFSNWFYNTNCV